MSIYVLPIDPSLQPHSQPFQYPKANEDYGVEQDFHRYILDHDQLQTGSALQAARHYLPIFWTRWHLNHDYGKEGRSELQRLVDESIIDDSKTFTICQYDDGPIADLGETAIFLSSRQTENGNDIPLLCSPHHRPFIRRRKKYLASFVGRLSTHIIRREMADQLQDHEAIFIYDGDEGEKFFVNRTVESYVALCPRGYGGSSFRFFEAMQLGVVPFLIGDRDTRPFKRSIEWDEVSLFANSPREIPAMLHSLSRPDLIAMGAKAAEVWQGELKYQKWCDHVIKELS